MSDGLPIPRNPLRAWVARNWWLAVGSLLASTAAGLGGVVVLGLLVLAVCALPFALSGVVVFASTIVLVGFDSVARAGVALTSGISIDRPAGIVHPRKRRTLTDSVRDVELWKSVGYWLLRIPVSGALVFVLPAFFVALPAIAVAPIVWVVVDPGARQLEIAEHTSLLPLSVAGGLALAVFVVALPPSITAIARVDWWCAKAMLGRSDASRRVDELTVSRARVVDAADAERRRIERDLHDGAQQRLVFVAMSLGQAKSRAAKSDDEVLRELLDAAHREAKNAIGEIRTLTRGLHPPILTDRGLDAALSSVAALCTVPVSIDIGDELLGRWRLDATRESTLYFVVSEALANVSKHSGASSAEITVTRVGDVVNVTVVDDGHGGAVVTPGGGLAGLADRLSGVDGTVTIDSPPGGPTRLDVTIPCE